jgi:hypothetical protein
MNVKSAIAMSLKPIPSLTPRPMPSVESCRGALTPTNPEEFVALDTVVDEAVISVVVMLEPA